MHILRIFGLCTLFLFAVSCDDDNTADDVPEAVDVDGLVTVESTASVDATVSRLQTALQANENIGVVATIDHAANAQANGLSLQPTTVILFGNPQLGTPLMQESQTAGLDLPQKILVYEDSSGTVRVAYNAAQYVADRHGITNQQQTISTIAGALSNLAENAAGQPINPNMQDDDTADRNEGIVTVASNNSVDDTYAALKTAIQNNDALMVAAELDHQENAASVDLELRPTRLLVFGNPQLGTPLMQSAQTTGIDLPQKFLVYEDANGDVFIAYNDPAYIADRHDLQSVNDQLNTISGALQNLATNAAE